jgi:hypothetical protein
MTAVNFSIDRGNVFRLLVIAASGDGFANERFGAAVGIHLRGVDQSHVEIDAETERHNFVLSAACLPPCPRYLGQAQVPARRKAMPWSAWRVPKFVSLVVIPTVVANGTISNAKCAKTQASSLSSGSSLHPPDWPIASRVCFQRQLIWIVLFFASWSEVLPHDVVLRRPIIVTLASQRFLTNPIVSYFVDLEARHIAHLAVTPKLYSIGLS